MESMTLITGTQHDIPVHYGVLALCGEHMNRVQQMAHWYPFGSLDYIRKILRGRTLYNVVLDDLLVGVFSLGPASFPYDDGSVWGDGSALYFAGFGVLPAWWGRGIGQWCMEQADRIALEGGYTSLRFDAVASNERLLRFYDGLGYQRMGTLLDGVVVCYEKLLTTQ